ncbi:MAG: hypothetical protein AMXMBFR48_27820 [Ignavibacteriales bacterium]
MIFNLNREIEQYLEAGENLIWTGQPKQGLVFSAFDIWMVIFGIIWTSGVVSWIYAAWDAAIWFAMFGLPFLLVGLYLIFGKFFIDARTRSTAIYAITNRRVIITYKKVRKKFYSYEYGKIREIALRENADKSGAIYLYFPEGWSRNAQVFRNADDVFEKLKNSNLKKAANALFNQGEIYSGMREDSFSLLPDARGAYEKLEEQFKTHQAKFGKVL